MSYVPTLLDAAADLRRCVYSSMETEDFQNPEFLIFWENAKKIISENDSKIKTAVRKYLYICLTNVQNGNLSKNKRQENILMAANLLQS